MRKITADNSVYFIKKLTRLVILAAVAVVLPLAAYSVPKDPTGTGIHGEVRDPEKAAIAGVHVKAMNEKTKLILITDTNAQGEFDLLRISSGIYDLTFYKDGFEYMLYPHVRVNKKTLLSLDVTIHRTSVVSPPKDQN
jgi:hypothetical protein